MIELTDESPMPFGKHKGKPMKHVPPGYLDWLAGQAWLINWPAVMAYIERKFKPNESATDKTRIKR